MKLCNLLKNKINNKILVHLLQTLIFLKQKCENISVIFMRELSKIYLGKNLIVVFANKLNKMIHIGVC